MSKYGIAEVFGYRVEDSSHTSWHSRLSRHCPFRDSKCTKGSRNNPLGVCTIRDGDDIAIICPYRFLENGIIFDDAINIAFPNNSNIICLPEIRLHTHGAGKFDFVLIMLDSSLDILDFHVLEIQSVYFSGDSLKPDFDYFMKHRTLPSMTGSRRPDYLSSSMKRLLPQLITKVDIIRRWGKKVFIAVDKGFFNSFGNSSFLKREADIWNADIAWMVYDITTNESGYILSLIDTVYTQIESATNAFKSLVSVPSKSEFIELLNRKIRKLTKNV